MHAAALAVQPGLCGVSSASESMSEKELTKGAKRILDETEENTCGFASFFILDQDGYGKKTKGSSVEDGGCGLVPWHLMSSEGGHMVFEAQLPANQLFYLGVSSEEGNYFWGQWWLGDCKRTKTNAICDLIPKDQGEDCKLIQKSLDGDNVEFEVQAPGVATWTAPWAAAATAPRSSGAWTTAGVSWLSRNADAAAQIGGSLAIKKGRPFGIGRAGMDMKEVLPAAGLERERGLSYYEAVPLDGRLDPSRGRPAREWLQQVTAAELAEVLQDGEGWSSPILAQRMAEAILHRQQRSELRRIQDQKASELLRCVPPTPCQYGDGGGDGCAARLRVSLHHLDAKLTEAEKLAAAYHKARGTTLKVQPMATLQEADKTIEDLKS
eukprot:Skav207672  [mRNA]  locus=scaffold1857:313240:327323:- [translate_table: standard]